VSPRTAKDPHGAHLPAVVARAPCLHAHTACAVIALLERTGFPDVLGRQFVFVRM
jgi:hypothetical protein